MKVLTNFILVCIIEMKFMKLWFYYTHDNFILSIGFMKFFMN